MATLSPTVSLREPKTGGGGVRPPSPGGGGGNGGDGNGYPDYGGRLRRARVGLLVALAPILMLFVAFTSALVMRRGLPMMVDGHAGQYVHDWLAINLPMTLLLVNTGLIVLSSLTMELARRQITRRTALAGVDSIPGVSVGNESNFPWLGVSMLLGIGFLVGQLFAWRELENRGFYLATSASSSFVYLLTAAHGVHLFGGLVVMLYAQATSWLHKPVEERRIVVDVTAWYWHFMALLWIYVFALLWYAR
jgi:cytochrome c oxidase subunit III